MPPRRRLRTACRRSPPARRSPARPTSTSYASRTSAVGLADDEHARDVGAVAVHRAAEVAQHDVAALDDPRRRVVVRARGVRSARRRWRSSPARDRRRACARRARGARRARCGRRTGRRAWPTAISSTACAGARERGRPRRASLTTRSGPVTSIARAEAGAGQRGLEREHEAGPGVVADRDDAGAAPTCAATRGDRGRRSRPRARATNASGCSTTRGASSRGTTSTASPSAGTTSMVRRSSGIAS